MVDVLVAMVLARLAIRVCSNGRGGLDMVNQADSGEAKSATLMEEPRVHDKDTGW